MRMAGPTTRTGKEAEALTDQLTKTRVHSREATVALTKTEIHYILSELQRPALCMIEMGEPKALMWQKVDKKLSEAMLR